MPFTPSLDSFCMHFNLKPFPPDPVCLFNQFNSIKSQWFKSISYNSIFGLHYQLFDMFCGDVLCLITTFQKDVMRV